MELKVFAARGHHAYYAVLEAAGMRVGVSSEGVLFRTESAL